MMRQSRENHNGMVGWLPVDDLRRRRVRGLYIISHNKYEALHQVRLHIHASAVLWYCGGGCRKFLVMATWNKAALCCRSAVALAKLSTKFQTYVRFRQQQDLVNRLKLCERQNE